MKEASESKKSLDRFVGLVKPELEKLGFVYKEGSDAASSGGPFANGFFKSGKYNIGIVFRRDQGLGCIIYETNYTNLAHYEVFNGLGRHDKNRMKYNRDMLSMCSYTLDGSELHEAFLDDFKNVIYPFFDKSSIEEINKFMLAERKKSGH